MKKSYCRALEEEIEECQASRELWRLARIKEIFDERHWTLLLHREPDMEQRETIVEIGKEIDTMVWRLMRKLKQVTMNSGLAASSESKCVYRGISAHVANVIERHRIANAAVNAGARYESLGVDGGTKRRKLR